MLLKVMKGGVRGVITPWVILGGGVIIPWVNLSVTGNGGTLPKVIPEVRGPPTPPPTPLIYWGDLSVTGNGDLPLATQRRVESIASDRSPFAVA